MNDAEQRRYLNTAAFHEKMARAFRQVGDVTNAEQAEQAAVVARESAERTPTRNELELDALSKVSDVLKPEPRIYREPVDMVCGTCGSKHCHGHPQERGVGR